MPPVDIDNFHALNSPNGLYVQKKIEEHESFFNTKQEEYLFVMRREK